MRRSARTSNLNAGKSWCGRKLFGGALRVRYGQFGDECETLQDAQKLAQFPNLRDPIIVNLDQVKRPASRLKLT